MGKRNTSIYVDDNILTQAMDKGINISQFCESCLRGALSQDLEVKDENVINTELGNLEAKIQDLKARKEGIEREKLRRTALGIKKDGWVIETKSKD
jgi:post-segregation antitoxin (ccd killing protein)